MAERPIEGSADRRSPWARVVLLVLLAGAGRLEGQADTTRTDSTRTGADSAKADSARADSVDSYTLIVRGQQDAQTYVRAFPRTGQHNLLPPFARIVIPRDSIDYINAETLGDILGTIPGIWLWRGGWTGRPEMPNFAGRGGGSVEYVIDGIPYVPMGPDSTAVDPTLLPTGLLDRIEIEEFPGLLRVNLFLRRHEVVAPRTRIAVGRGDFKSARYEGLMEKRWTSGFGFALGVEYRVNDGPNDAYGNTQLSNGWIQADYVPSETFGVQVRWLRSGPDRSTVLTRDAPIDTLVRPVKGTRNDFTTRVFLKSRGESRVGPRLDAILNHSSWGGDSLDQSRWVTGLLLSDRYRTTSYGLTALYGSRWTRLDTRANAGWSPSDRLSASLEAAYQTYDEHRSAKWITGRVGATLPLGFTVSGTWREGNVVDQPTIRTDSAQDVSDREVIAEWSPGRAFTARGGYLRLAAFRPAGYWYFPQVDSIPPSGPTEWFTVGGRLAPRQWLTVSGWYQYPLSPGGPEGTPPGHSFIEAAIQSRFLRTFPSGIFNLKLAATMENWATGVIGRDPTGAPVTLKGATYFRMLLQMQFLGFIVYYDRSNFMNSDLPFVPGLPMPRSITTFGVRWTFLN